MYYDNPSWAQATKLMDIFQEPVISHLVSWGMERLEHGDTSGLSNGLWTKGRFSEFIQAGLEDRLEAERLIIHQMAKDFVRFYINQNKI